MQQYPPYPPYPPTPPSRTPWAIIITVLVIVLLGFGGLIAGGFFLFFGLRSAAPPPAATWSPPPPPPAPTPVPTPTPMPTVTVPPAATASATTVHAVPVGSSPVRGRADALVTIVEFGDFQCPFCKRAQVTLDALRVKYGSDLRIVWKNMPLAFHVRALPAAELALEARAEKGDATFWTVHDDLYLQPYGGLDDTALGSIARLRGVNETKVSAAISGNTYQSVIDADSKLAKAVGVTGTPTFFVNGRELEGAQPQYKFEVLIDEELKKAKDRVAKGTPRARVYDEIMAGAHE